jgi:hypothetical protein
VAEQQGAENNKPNPLARALLTAADLAILATTDSYAASEDDGPKLTATQVADHGVAHWGKFARKRGLAYRKELPVAEILADPRLASFFEELRQLHFPILGPAGLLETTWQGVQFTSFTAYSVSGDSIEPFRLICTPLTRTYPDLVRDQRMQVYPDHRRHMYPNYDHYELVDGPVPPPRKPEREPGLLGRTPVGQEVRKAVKELFGPRPPKLHTNSREYAAAIASRPYEGDAFKFDWAVRGRWLVMYQEEHIRAFGAPDKTPEMLDAFVSVKRLVD